MQASGHEFGPPSNNRVQIHGIESSFKIDKMLVNEVGDEITLDILMHKTGLKMTVYTNDGNGYGT